MAVPSPTAELDIVVPFPTRPLSAPNAPDYHVSSHAASSALTERLLFHCSMELDKAWAMDLVAIPTVQMWQSGMHPPCGTPRALCN